MQNLIRAGPLRWVGSPVTFSATPNRDPLQRESWHCPYIGEHSAQMLAELGFSAAEAARLRDEGARSANVLCLFLVLAC